MEEAVETPKMSWRLNERHYGSLQGLNKKETVEKFGKEQVQIWRRSYDIAPPLAEDTKKNDIDADIEAHTKGNSLFLKELQNELVKQYKDFANIAIQLDYLKNMGLFEDLDNAQFSSFKQALNVLFQKGYLTKDQQNLLNQENEYLKVRGESLKNTEARVKKWLRLEYLQWQDGDNILIVAHGNSLRALIKKLENISNTEITGLNIPTGSPILYKLEGLKVLNKDYAEEESVIKARAQKVAEQTGKK